METRFTILLIEIGIAVTVQACVLIGILIAVRKSTTRMTTLAEEMQKRAIPTLENVQKLVEFTRPRVETAVENFTQASNSVRTQVQKLDVAVNDLVDRAKKQVVRADDLVTRTLDRVENTTEVVNSTVISPFAPSPASFTLLVPDSASSSAARVPPATAPTAKRCLFNKTLHSLG